MLSELLKKLGIGKDSPVPASSFLDVANKLLDDYAAQVLTDDAYQSDYNLSEYPAGIEILALSQDAQVAVVLVTWQRIQSLVPLMRSGSTDEAYRAGQCYRLLKDLAATLLCRKLPFNVSQIAFLLHADTGQDWFHYAPYGSFIRAAEDHAATDGESKAFLATLEKAIVSLAPAVIGADHRKAIRRLQSLCDGQLGNARIHLTRSEIWSAALLDFVATESPERQKAWAKLLAFAANSSSSKPTKKWLKEAQSLVDAIGPAAFRDRLLEWIALIEKGGRHEPAVGQIPDIKDEHLIMDSLNAQTLKGLVWCATLIGDNDDVCRAIGRLGAACYRKIQWIGARSTAVANACVWALGAIPGRESVAQLSFLRSKSKYQAAKHSVEKALNAAAAREGITTDDLEELAVPTLGLGEVGRRTMQLGDYLAELTIEDTHTVDLNWTTAKGKPQKSVPAAVKTDFAGSLKELKAAQKELQKLLPSLRSRIESSYLRQKHWTLAALRERYLDHPVVGTLASRLIWSFHSGPNSTQTAIWHNGALTSADGQLLNDLLDDTQVELWHPSAATVDEVVAWRSWLERNEITQPFKQAHREIYLLTDAERNTGNYSNRFAAHILRQHQLAALCTERGWRYRLQGNFDSANTPVIELPQWDLRVEFWVEPVESNEISAMGIFNYLSTDQVRFYRIGDPAPINLADVPPLVFTELMRDVDLFVGVCSVGNDPTWGDRGADDRYNAYWQSYSFGDLSATAKTRREILTRLVPRLKIADRATLDEKFLIVRGDIRTYKIHLGSGNILMEPNDTYLCIVPGQGSAARGTSRVFLPFEGDNVLSIILSKALLLADDKKITDPAIVNQIRVR